MIRWTPYAFVRITIFFIAGICLGIYAPKTIEANQVIFLFFLLVSGYGTLLILFSKKRFLAYASSLKIWCGLFGLSAIFVSGIISVLLNTDTSRSHHLASQSDVTFFTVTITSIPEEKTNSWKMEAMVKAVKDNHGWKETTGKILLYLSNDQRISYTYGHELLVKGAPVSIPPPTNPEEFDYKRFLGFKNIHHQYFAKSENVRLIGFNPPSVIRYYALKGRVWADQTLSTYISGSREQSLASALVLGVTDGLDNELLSAYKATGTMHVLAVSGLHVGIIYGLLVFIFRPLKKVKHGTWIIALLSLLVLWSYAFITGLSPSVLRAVTMFSFMALAKPAGRRTNIYNTLAVSAFFILLYDPFLIMSVGFQLSYMAVLGIVYMQPRLYNFCNPTNRLFDEVWKITSVSIAAQLATFSLGLFYFHQFPNYFLLSNLVVIPASFIILILGILILVTSFVQVIAAGLGFLVSWSIKILNAIVFALEGLPFSLLDNIYISSFQCWVLMALIFSILILLRSRKFSWIVATSVLAIVFSVAQWYHFQREVAIQKMIVYNVKGHSAIDLIDQGKVLFLTDSLLQQDLNKVTFHITPNRIKHGVRDSFLKNSIAHYEKPGYDVFVWRGKTFLKVYDKKFSPPANIHVDFSIISNNAVDDPAAFCNTVNSKHIILDSSNSVKYASRFSTYASGLTNVHNVLQNGAFEMNL